MLKLNQILLISATLASVPALAGVNDNDIYAGFGVGQSYLGPDYENGDKGPRDRDLALQVFLGYDIGDNFGIEANYANLGDLDVGDKKLGYGVYSLQGLLYLPTNADEISVYAKLGGSYLDLDNNNDVAVSKKRDWTLSGGLGVRWNMDENWFTRAEYNYYNADIQAGFLQIGYSWGGYSEEPIYVEPAPTLVTLDDAEGVPGIFNFDSAEINNPARLDQISMKLRESQGQIIVKAHTDSIGTEAYNQQLSEKRAQSAVNYFVSKGIDRNRFIAQGMGELYPVESNMTKEGRAKNRRLDVEYTILKQK